MPNWPKSYILTSLNKWGRNKKVIVIGLCLILLLFILLSLSLGAVHLSLSQLIATIRLSDASSKYYQILYYVRIPRTLAAILAGSALSVSGVILQSLLNNPLASPGIIGVNSGAGLFSIAIAAFFPTLAGFSPIAAFVGGLVAAFTVYTIAHKTGASRMSIVLAGIAISAMLGALIDTILTLFPEVLLSRSAFLIGGFSGISMGGLGLSLYLIPLGLILALVLSYELEVLSLGESTAMSLGLNTRVYRLIFITLAALLAGSSVSFAGLLGFVGLIVSHMARFLVGHNKRLLMPVAMLLGAGFTLACDLAARMLFRPYEIPVGIVMSFLGGPFFIYLLFRQKKRRLHD